MRILEINKFNYRKRGADKHFLDVVELLEKNGHEVAIFSMHSRNNLPSKWSRYFLSTVGYTNEYSWAEKIKGVFRMFFSWEAKRKINAILDEFKPDVVHIHNIYHQLSPCILFEIKKRNIPVVMTVHDYKLINPNHDLFLNGRPYDRCKNGRFYQCFLDKCVKDSYAKSFLAMLEMYWHEWLGTYRKNIDVFIAPSLFVKNTLTEWGIPVAKTIVIPHFIPEKNDAAILPNMEVSGKYALYAGSISKEKGLRGLIKIFQNILGLKLCLAGTVENNFAIPESENIEYLGYLTQTELKKYITGASVVVSGSRLPETFGLVALEAITQGKPFVGFKVGAFSEIIENGKNGFLVLRDIEFQEKIKSIAEGKTEFDSMAIKSDALDKFSEEKYAKSLLTIFDNLTIDKRV